MTKIQALILAILVGLVMLACIGIALVILAPSDRLLGPPTPPPPTNTPTITPSPTLPNFMPTPNFGPTVEPTATGTRVATATPNPSRTPTPTVLINLPISSPQPSATPLITVTLAPLIPPTLTLEPTAFIPSPRGFKIDFKADDISLERGICTDLVWRIDGQGIAQLDGRQVNFNGKKEVCPDQDETYVLTVQFQGSTSIERRRVTIFVETPVDE